MSTTVNYTQNGKPVSKTFRTKKEIVKYFEQEGRKLEVKEKALDKYPELRSMLHKEKSEYKGIADFFRALDSDKTTVRDYQTGKTLEIETR